MVYLTSHKEPTLKIPLISRVTFKRAKNDTFSKVTNWVFSKSYKQLHSTAQQLSNDWSHYRVLSIESNVRKLYITQGFTLGVKALINNIQQLSTSRNEIQQLSTTRNYIQQLSTPRNNIQQLSTSRNEIQQLSTPRNYIQQLSTSRNNIHQSAETPETYIMSAFARAFRFEELVMFLRKLV